MFQALVSITIWVVSMAPPLLSVAALTCGMHAFAERWIRENIEASWSASGLALAMAGASLLGVGCTGIQMAIRVSAVLGAALCLAGWVFAHSEMELHQLLQATHNGVTHTELALQRMNLTAPAALMCTAKGLHDSILLLLALQRTVEFWKAVSQHLAMIVKLSPMAHIAGIAAIAGV